MKFFTPELYLRFNSADDAEADRADADWETALQEYQAHLDAFRGHLPPRVSALAERLCLHDAELVRDEEVTSEPGPGPFFSHPLGLLNLVVRHGEVADVLTYLLWGPVRRFPPPDGWPFSAAKVHWLYDEIDEDERGRGAYWHRVLWSDGSTTEVPFFDVMVHELALQSPALAPAGVH
jgi:hypothetical protein